MGFAAIEAEDELVEIALTMLFAQAVIDAERLFTFKSSHSRPDARLFCR
jgi:hypothetical protein